MKSLASCVISSKLSSLNSHCAAVTEARVSASSSPWNGDSPLSLQTGEDDPFIAMSFEHTPLGGSTVQGNSETTSLSGAGSSKIQQQIENVAYGYKPKPRAIYGLIASIGFSRMIITDCECECEWVLISVFWLLPPCAGKEGGGWIDGWISLTRCNR